MGQSSSIPQVTSNYTDPLHLRLRFHYDPFELYAKPRPYTTAQVAKLVRSDWPTFFNFFNSSDSIAFGPEQPRYKSDDIVNGHTCLYIPPKRIHLTSANIREVREVHVGSRDTTTARQFCIDIVTQLVKNPPKPVQTYLDKVSRGKYLVRVADSYPLDKLVHDAFTTVQHHWLSGGWLQADWRESSSVNQKRLRSTTGRGDIYPDTTTRGAPLWYEYVPAPTPSKHTRKRTLSTRHTSLSSSHTPPSTPRKTSQHRTNRQGTAKTRHIIRFTGFRDADLAAKLEAKGHEVATGSMTNRVSVVVWDGTRKSRSVLEAEARPGITLWRRDDALGLA